MTKNIAKPNFVILIFEEVGSPFRVGGSLDLFVKGDQMAIVGLSNCRFKGVALLMALRSQ